MAHLQTHMEASPGVTMTINIVKHKVLCLHQIILDLVVIALALLDEVLGNIGNSHMEIVRVMMDVDHHFLRCLIIVITILTSVTVTEEQVILVIPVHLHLVIIIVLLPVIHLPMVEPVFRLLLITGTMGLVNIDLVVMTIIIQDPLQG